MFSSMIFMIFFHLSSLPPTLREQMMAKLQLTRTEVTELTNRIFFNSMS